MSYSEQFLDNVQSFGILGYSVDKIIDLVDPEDEEQFRNDFADPKSCVYKAYRKGKTTGEYNLDKELFDASTKSHDVDANEALKNRLQRNKIDDMIYTHFSI